jgi:hypothetical protein
MITMRDLVGEISAYSGDISVSAARTSERDPLAKVHGVGRRHTMFRPSFRYSRRWASTVVYC